jgi:hypothetical protein
MQILEAHAPVAQYLEEHGSPAVSEAAMQLARQVVVNGFVFLRLIHLFFLN